MGRMLLQLLAMFAQFERDTIIERVIAGMERGHRTTTGGQWSAHQVVRELANRVHLGERTFRGTTVTDTHDPIITPDTWAHAEAILAARRDELTDLIDTAPSTPDPATLDQVAEIIATGTANRRKALVEALVDKVTITGPDRPVPAPVFRIPQPGHDTGAAPASPAGTTPDAMVRTPTNSVDLTGALAHVTPATRRLLAMADTWSTSDNAAGTAVTPVPRFQPKQQPSFEEQLGEAGVAKLVADFLGGAASHQDLAARHGTSVSTIKRLLRKRDARLWVMEAEADTQAAPASLNTT